MPQIAALVGYGLLAIATLYLTSVGTEVVSNGHRRWVDPHWFRGNSYLKIGWHWLHRALLSTGQKAGKDCKKKVS